MTHPGFYSFFKKFYLNFTKKLFFSRNEQNSDGSFIDNFVKTIVGGRKIHGGKSAQKVRPIDNMVSYFKGPVKDP